jgi:SAM-dependent methyltransferase
VIAVPARQARPQRAGTGQDGPAPDGSPGGRRSPFPDWRFAPNIGAHPGVYQIENEALDRAGHVLDALRALAPWAGKTIVDLGCGTGYWLARYAEEAGAVIGIEPDEVVRAQAGRAVADLASAGPTETGLAAVPEVRAGSAEHTGLPDACADVVHARFAYFFPPDADAGLAEVLRILRPGGRLLVVDNDYRWGEFAGLLSAASGQPPREVAATVDQWWQVRGARRHEIRSELRFASRADLAAVLGIEFPAAVADDWLARHPAATGLTYGYVLFEVARPASHPFAVARPGGSLLAGR